jgi:uncharacterized protein (TIGR02246 family)
MIVIGMAMLMAAAAAQAGDAATVQALEDRFAAAANAGDAAAIGALYDADATALPPAMSALTGRAAIQGFWAQAAAGVTDVRLHTVSARRLGADAIEEIGTYAMQPKAAGAAALHGNYVVVWRRGSDGWKLATDIWN